MKNEMQKLESINPLMLIQNAVDAKASIEHLEKLMDLQERFEKNQAEKQFNEAMQTFQSKKPKLVKNKSVEYNGKEKYKFLPLPKMQEQIDPILSECGLTYNWEQTGNGGTIKIACTLSHVSGHSKTTYLEAQADGSGGKNSVQAIGSTVSYLKRYTLENVLGLSADTDDDGENLPDVSKIKEIKMHSELCTLYIMKKSRLDKNLLERLESIIIEQEVQSYQKAINNLKTL